MDPVTSEDAKLVRRLVMNLHPEAGRELVHEGLRLADRMEARPVIVKPKGLKAEY